MANTITTRVLQGGPGVVVVSVTGKLDTSDLASTNVVTPTTTGIAYTDIMKKLVATGFMVEEIIHNVEEGLYVNLYFEATPTSDLIAVLTAGGDTLTFRDAPRFCAVAGKTGNITMDTSGWSAGQDLRFTVKLRLRQQTS